MAKSSASSENDTKHPKRLRLELCVYVCVCLLNPQLHTQVCGVTLSTQELLTHTVVMKNRMWFQTGVVVCQQQEAAGLLF